MSSRNAYRKVAVLNGLKTTNLVASPSLTTSYNLTLPSATPTVAGQSLISDTAGNLSWGSSTGTLSSYTGTVNPLTTSTNVTGLLFTSSYSQINVYVAVNATTNIYSLYSVRVYQKGSTASWGLSYDVDCDTDDVDPPVVFSVTSTGQIQYTLPTTLPGFVSVVMMWSLGTSVSNTLTSLVLSSTLNVGGPSTFTAGMQGTSLALTSTLNVTGLATHAAMTGLSLVLGNATASGAVSSTVGTFLSLQNQTYTDATTAASSTAAGTFSAAYLGIPTLAATNTAVTTSTASTLTIAGPPTAGTNTTITNAYALNVMGGNVVFGGNITYTGLLMGPRVRRDSIQLSGQAGVNFGSTALNYYIPLSGGTITVINSTALGTMQYFGAGFDCIQNTDTVAHYWLISVTLMAVGANDFFWYEVGSQKANTPYQNYLPRYCQINANTNNGTALCYLVPVQPSAYVHLGRYGLSANTSQNYPIVMSISDQGII